MNGDGSSERKYCMTADEALNRLHEETGVPKFTIRSIIYNLIEHMSPTSAITIIDPDGMKLILYVSDSQPSKPAQYKTYLFKDTELNELKDAINSEKIQSSEQTSNARNAGRRELPEWQDAEDDLYSFLDENYTSRDFSNITITSLEQWIEGWFSKRGFAPDSKTKGKKMPELTARRNHARGVFERWKASVLRRENAHLTAEEAKKKSKNTK